MIASTKDAWVPFAERVRLVRHAAFNRSLKACIESDRAPAGTIFFVVGPSGVGKTELSKLIGPALFGEQHAPHVQPYIRISAENPEAGFFTSKYMISQMLSKFRDPFSGMAFDVPDGVPPDLMPRLGRALGKIATGARTTEEDKRKAVIGLSKELQCRLVIVDEANLMSLVKKGRPVEAHLESLRTLAHAMGVRIILLGTFMMLDYVDYSAQISRTGFIEHLDRIRGDTEAGMLDFLGLLDHVELDLGLDLGVLTRKAGELYEGTYGITGELISLLERARIHAAVGNRHKICDGDIEAALPLPAVKERMRAEADFVEAFVKGVDVEELQRFNRRAILRGSKVIRGVGKK